MFHGLADKIGVAVKDNVQPYFVNKRIVVIGASSGVGEALSYWYLNHGAMVVMVGKDEEKLKVIGKQYPHQATCVVANITDDYQCKVS